MVKYVTAGWTGLRSDILLFEICEGYWRYLDMKNPMGGWRDTSHPHQIIRIAEIFPDINMEVLQFRD